MFRHSMVLLALFGLASIGRAGAESFFEQKVHDFGATPRGPTLIHYFRFTNNSQETVTIGKVDVSCGCTTGSAPVSQVKPGETSYITAQMDTRRFSGPKTVTVYVNFTSPRYEQVSLQVQANGRDDLTMTPDSIAFGTIRKGKEAKSSVQVTFVGDPKWDVKEAKAESNYVKPQAKIVKRNGVEVTFEISAALRPDLPIGKWYTEVSLTTNNPNVATINIPLTVEVGAAVTATPDALSLGDIKVGDTVEQKIVVRGEKPFKIKSVQGTDTLVSITEPSKDSKAMHILTVIIKPAQAGAIARDLSIQTEGEEATTLNVPIKATATKE